MAALSCTQAIATAMKLLGVLGRGEVPTGDDDRDGMRIANMMLGSWSLQSLTVPYQQRFTGTSNTANVGTYTIGTGGDFNTPRPSGQANLVGAGLLLASSSPVVEIPRSIFTYAGYEAIGIKDLSNTLWTGLLYRPTFPLGTIQLWPIPSEVNGIALYINRSLSKFDDLTTAVEFPDGTDGAIAYNLAVALAPEFSVEVPQAVLATARTYFGAMKRNNVQFVDAALDPMWTIGQPGGAYNINTGSVQRFGP